MSPEITTNMTNTKQITLPLKELIEILYGNKFQCYISKAMAERILSIDKEEEFAHIEPGTNPDVYQLFTRKEWRIEHVKRLRDQENSEVFRRYHALLNDRATRIAKAIADVLKLNTTAPFSELANNLAKQSNITIAPMLAAYKIDVATFPDYITENEIRVIYQQELHNNNIAMNNATEQLQDSPNMKHIQEQAKRLRDKNL